MHFKYKYYRGAWVAQSVKRLTSAWVMTLQFVGLSPTLGSVLTARSLKPASDSVSPPLSAPPLLMLSLSKINIYFNFLFFKIHIQINQHIVKQ